MPLSTGSVQQAGVGEARVGGNDASPNVALEPLGARAEGTKPSMRPARRVVRVRRAIDAPVTRRGSRSRRRCPAGSSRPTCHRSADRPRSAGVRHGHVRAVVVVTHDVGVRRVGDAESRSMLSPTVVTTWNGSAAGAAAASRRTARRLEPDRSRSSIRRTRPARAGAAAEEGVFRIARVVDLTAQLGCRARCGRAGPPTRSSWKSAPRPRRLPCRSRAPAAAAPRAGRRPGTRSGRCRSPGFPPGARASASAPPLDSSSPSRGSVSWSSPVFVKPQSVPSSRLLPLRRDALPGSAEQF